MRSVCVVILAGFATQTLAAETAPLARCYERVYDASHLAAHPGQIVTHIRLRLGDAPKEEKKWEDLDPTLSIWVKGHKKGFEAPGGCKFESDGLHCHAATSAAESDDICKKETDGARECRVRNPDGGAYGVTKHPDGILVTIRERLEMLEPQSDSVPYLYLSPGNTENHAFLLKQVAESVCR